MDFSKVMDYKFPGNVRELKAMLDCYRVFNRFEIKPEEKD
jgi:transcriptional regulator with GAF, ATPase, and Fis domain